MKATGIVRRIDDLGRVVVPKEIRRTLRIREGDPLEIFTDREGEIILKKYSPIGELSQFAGQYAKTLAETTGYLVCVADRDHIIAVSGSGRKDYEGKRISEELEAHMEARKNSLHHREDKEYIPIVEGEEAEYPSQAIATIIAQGDAIGSVIMFSRQAPMKEMEKQLVMTAASFLGSQMEQ